jgi:ABC-type polysaccharide/polyol phosphate export permease
VASNPRQVLQLTVIDSSNDWLNWPKRLRELVIYRFLLQNLVKRDLKVRYRNSVLGILWSLLNPLIMMLVFSLIFGKLLPREDIRQYAVFFLVGLLPWNFFSGSLMGGTVSIVADSSLIKKIFFPREMIPTAVLFSNLVNFLLAFVVLLVFLYASGLGLTVHALWLPAILITHLIFTLGLVLFFSALHVFYRDMIMILDVALLAWFFMTPVLYPLEWLGESQTVLGITFEPAVVMRWVNPMASIIDSYRTVLWGTTGSNGPAAMDPVFLLRTFMTSMLVFVIGYGVFTRVQYLFAEKL